MNGSFRTKHITLSQLFVALFEIGIKFVGCLIRQAPCGGFLPCALVCSLVGLVLCIVFSVSILRSTHFQSNFSSK